MAVLSTLRTLLIRIFSFIKRVAEEVGLREPFRGTLQPGQGCAENGSGFPHHLYRNGFPGPLQPLVFIRLHAEPRGKIGFRETCAGSGDP